MIVSYQVPRAVKAWPGTLNAQLANRQVGILFRGGSIPMGCISVGVYFEGGFISYVKCGGGSFRGGIVLKPICLY